MDNLENLEPPDKHAELQQRQFALDREMMAQDEKDREEALVQAKAEHDERALKIRALEN